ncbi:hypothetical protein BDZ91DRAFT_723124 [Kalaharituber pfeilii]|nr:hypothetical protein BDZ91DRAFT_723124 [Kalaharituber pfeilii]
MSASSLVNNYGTYFHQLRPNILVLTIRALTQTPCQQNANWRRVTIIYFEFTS